jgi:Tfp pilus assembly PilM family ATPase
MRSIGIDPGDHTVKVVELDGSYRRTRLLRAHIAPAVAPGSDGAARAEAVAAAARAAFDEGMRGDTCLGHPCREAVLRTLELPFKGTEAIRKVVKSEIEGEIQSQSVDDMVVDFHEIGAGSAGGTKILVASVPKAGLRAQLDALAAHKIEPETVDLDTMALWRVAHWVGAFVPEASEDAAEAGDGDKLVTAVVDIGARSTRVILVDGEQLVEMRALRFGDGVVADEVARRHGLDGLTARDAVHACLTSGSDQRLEVPVAPLAPASGASTGAAAADAGVDAPAAAAPRAVLVAHADVESAHAAFLQRLARELTRFLTASGREGEVRALWVTGGATRGPGTHEMLATVFGVEARDIDVLGRLQHDLTPEQVADLGSRLANAVGLALGKLGGPEGFQLRREDLVLTRGFERIKFPLAIACMVALLALFVQWNKKQLQLANLEYEIGRTYVSKDPKVGKQFFGELGGLFNAAWFDKGDMFRIEGQKAKDYTFKDLVDELAAAPVYQRLTIVRDRLKAVADQKQKASGIFEDISLESGLAVLVRWTEVLKSVEPQLGRYLVTKIDLSMKSPNRHLEFTIAFRDPDFRKRRQVLASAITAEIQKPDSPFEPATSQAVNHDTDEVFKDPTTGEIDANTVGAYCAFTMAIKDSFPPFGPGNGGSSVGAVPAPPVRSIDPSTTKPDGKDAVATTGGKK